MNNSNYIEWCCYWCTKSLKIPFHSYPFLAHLFTSTRFSNFPQVPTFLLWLFKLTKKWSLLSFMLFTYTCTWLVFIFIYIRVYLSLLPSTVDNANKLNMWHLFQYSLYVKYIHVSHLVKLSCIYFYIFLLNRVKCNRVN